MSHQQPLGGPGQQPPTSYPPQAYAQHQHHQQHQHQHQQYVYAPGAAATAVAAPTAPEYQAHDLDALPSIRSLSYVPPIQRPQGVEMGAGMAVAQPYYAGVMPMGPQQFLHSDGMMRYPVLPPDHRFRGPKKVGLPAGLEGLLFNPLLTFFFGCSFQLLSLL